jgi:hypothetical protein
MNKNKLIFIFGLIFLFGVVVIKYDFEKERSFPATLWEFFSYFEPCGSYDGTSNVMCSGHIAMMKSFLGNLKNGNQEKVVAQIKFPLIFHLKGNQLIELDNPEQFRDKYYPYVFPIHIIKDLLKLFENEDDMLWKNGNQMTFGRGALWFDMDTGKVITVNHRDDSLIQKMIDENHAEGVIANQ